MKTFVISVIFSLLCTRVHSCKTTWEICKKDSDCCEDHHCKDVDEEGNGKCISDCGKIGSIAPIIKGEERQYLGVPWHAAIYELNQLLNTYEHQCCGTLISSRVVVSSASCFLEDDAKHPSFYEKKLTTFKVGIGKYYTRFTAEDAFTQIKNIEKILFPEEYIGKWKHYSHNIAFLILSKKIDYTWAVTPICIDVDERSLEDRVIKKPNRRFAGWGLINWRLPIEKMQFIETPFAPRNECITDLGSSWLIFMNDKQCATEQKMYYGVCEAKIGDGLIFFEPIEKKYYLRGVFGSLNSSCRQGKGVKTQFIKLSSYTKILFNARGTSEHCKPLEVDSEKISLKCYTPSFKSVSCNDSLEANSKVKLSCNSPIYWRTREQNPYIGCREGLWNRPAADFVCELNKAECGITESMVSGNGRKNQMLSFPWHAGIYKGNSLTKQFDYRCGGTLISPKVVISAAQCFVAVHESIPRVLFAKPDLFGIMLGKNSRSSQTVDPASYNQFKKVLRIEIPKTYLGKWSHHENNIAFVVLRDKVEYSWAVLPICVDVGENSFDKDQLVRGVVGEMASWKPNDGLEIKELTFVPRNECLRDIGATNKKYLKMENKFCARGENFGRPFCEVAGGGLAFLDPTKRKYYLRGVISSDLGCSEKGVLGTNKTGLAFFTKTTTYKEELERYNRDFLVECEPLVSKKLVISCFTPFNEQASCKKRLKVNSRATFQCKFPPYRKLREPQYSEITCMNGVWDPPLIDDFCDTECGIAGSDLPVPAIKKGEPSGIGKFPWHAGIYESKSGKYEQICGGTLISQKVVISAAHCFATVDKEMGKIQKKEYSLLKVALGKYYRDFDEPRDDAFAQIKDVEDVGLCPDYRGFLSLYKGDIAFVILKEPVEYTRAVAPICLDTGKQSFEQDQLVKGAKGKVVGWGKTDQGQPSEKLLQTELPFVTREDCETDIGFSWLPYFTDEKICAGDKKFRSNVCQGDSGGGLVFMEPTKKRYYLRGVVSLGPPCQEDKSFALFTKLSAYKKEVEKYYQLY